MCLYHRSTFLFCPLFKLPHCNFPNFLSYILFLFVCLLIQKHRFVFVSKLLILIHKNTMVIKATTKIIIKVTVTPTKADVSTHREELTASTLPSKLITTSSPLCSWEAACSSAPNGRLTSWMSLGASTWKIIEIVRVNTCRNVAMYQNSIAGTIWLFKFLSYNKFF